MCIYFSIKVSIILPKCFVTPSQKHFGSIILTLIIEKYMYMYIYIYIYILKYYF